MLCYLPDGMKIFRVETKGRLENQTEVPSKSKASNLVRALEALASQGIVKVMVHLDQRGDVLDVAECKPEVSQAPARIRQPPPPPFRQRAAPLHGGWYYRGPFVGPAYGFGYYY